MCKHDITAIDADTSKWSSPTLHERSQTLLAQRCLCSRLGSCSAVLFSFNSFASHQTCCYAVPMRAFRHQSAAFHPAVRWQLCIPNLLRHACTWVLAKLSSFAQEWVSTPSARLPTLHIVWCLTAVVLASALSVLQQALHVAWSCGVTSSHSRSVCHGHLSSLPKHVLPGSAAS